MHKLQPYYALGNLWGTLGTLGALLCHTNTWGKKYCHIDAYVLVIGHIILLNTAIKVNKLNHPQVKNCNGIKTF